MNLAGGSLNLPGALGFDWLGQRLWLLPEKALYWREMNALVVADAHWGKDAAFRAGAIAVPVGVLPADLNRLATALERTGASRVYFLGDLLHARAGVDDQTRAEVSAWRARFPRVEMTLVRGNHDRRAGDPPPEWGITPQDEPFMVGPFALRHQPGEGEDGQALYGLAGHIHPAVRLNGAGGGLTLPCFWFGPRQAVLPAFGSFTGTAVVRPSPGDRVFVLAGDQVMEVSKGEG